MADDALLLGKSTKQEWLALRFGNRHGLITGATGTGKTVSLQVLAEGFSAAGVPVFAADIKGDLSGVAAMGEGKPFILERARTVGLDWHADQFPVVFWDLFGEQGHPIRATVAEMGPLLLSRLMDLNETQEGVINILFHYADHHGLALLDLKDLRAMLQELGSNKELQNELRAAYGNVSAASVGAIQRQLLTLENQGGSKFFGEPALALKDLMRTDREGRGHINLLAADKLMASPQLYATFLLWLLSELFEELPEVGDVDKPKLVFFFDEAHLLFKDAPKALVEKIEQVVRLIRSKGVGVYFVTQNPLDVPETVLAQLGNRVQHALRAFTPRDQRAVKAAATTFRQNPNLNTEEVITQLGKGEALVSTLEGTVCPPSSSAPWSRRRWPGSARSPSRSAGRSWRRARSAANTTRPSIRSPPTRSCRSAPARRSRKPNRPSRRTVAASAAFSAPSSAGLRAGRQGPRPGTDVHDRDHHQECVELARAHRGHADRPGHHAWRPRRSRPPLTLGADRVNCSEIRR
jgi:hypothetical protein